VNTEPIWHGTAGEAQALADALTHNCACAAGSQQQCINVCATRAMMGDQRVLDGLVFARYLIDRLVAQEFDAHLVLNDPSPTQPG
jgi:hypothetical protein